MEEKKEIKVRLSTAICIVIILALIVALGVTYYFGFVANKNDKVGNEKLTNITDNVVSNVVKENETKKEENKIENIIETTNKEDEKEESTNVKGEKFIQFDTEFYDIKLCMHDLNICTLCPCTIVLVDHHSLFSDTTRLFQYVCIYFSVF